MYRFEVVNLGKTMIGQWDINSMEAENLTDMAEKTGACSGDVCDLSWKPMPTKSDTGEDKE